MRQPQAIRSKDSRRKLRRWGFAAVITRADGTKVGQNMPGVVYGDHQEALQVTERLKAAFTQHNPDIQVAIEPLGYETISIETKRQFEGLNDQASLIAKAAFILAEKYRLSVGVADKDVAAVVQEAIDEARKFLFPQHERAKQRSEQVFGDGQAQEAPVSIEPEPEKPKRKLGIEEVNRILSEPAEDIAEEVVEEAA